MKPFSILTAAALLCAVIPFQDPDYTKLLGKAKITLLEAIDMAAKAAGDGVVVQADLEEDKGNVQFAVDVAVGTKTRAISFRASDGKILENDTDDEDRSAIAKGVRFPLALAVTAAVGQTKGKAVSALFATSGGRQVAKVFVFDGGKVSVLAFDAVTGQAISDAPTQDKEPTAAPQQDRPFTQTFAAEDDHYLGPTGKNPWFVIEPGYVLELRGKEGDQDSSVTITVLDETKKLGGIEARVVEEKHVVGGQLIESTRDYFAISKRTNNVYYLGEEVDNYKDGKIHDHEGTWLHGQNGAHYGLFIAAIPLLGARYYQELASPVAMDRAEVIQLDAKVEVPAGKFESVLVTEETTPLEKGKEKKYYAKGIGLLQDGDCKLVRYGPLKKK